MRAIALLLLIANLAYFGWAMWIDSKPSAPSTSSEALEVPRLVLASERPTDSPTERPHNGDQTPSSSPAEPRLEPSTQKCISLGPFQDLASVVEASAALKGNGFESRQRLEQGELWVGYWVSIPGSATHEQAERALARLKEKGITDAYILPGVEQANVISLGVFKDHDRAQRRFSEAKSLGFPAQIVDRTRAGSVYWIDVDLKSPTQSPPDPSLLGSHPGKIVRLESRPCPAEK